VPIENSGSEAIREVPVSGPTDTVTRNRRKANVSMLIGSVLVGSNPDTDR